MHVIVVGGGIGGLASALALSRAGIGSTVLERATVLGEAGAGVQLSPNAVRVLDSLGTGAAIRTAGFVPEAAEVRDHASGRLLLRNRLGAAAEARWGALYLQIHRSDLQAALLAAIRKRVDIELRLGTEVAAVDAVEGRVRTAAGLEIAGDAVVGADGVRSMVRAALWSDAPPRFSGQTAWRGVAPIADVAGAAALTGAMVWIGPHAHFVCYPVRAGSLINFVAVTEQAAWTGESWTAPGDPAALKAAFAGWPPLARALIDATAQVWRWGLFDRPPMACWSKGRATLLGDAAHPMLPFLAQGAAMAIEDAAVLARCLSAPDGAVEGLRRYQVARLARTAKAQAWSRRNGRLFHLPDVLAQAAFGGAAAADRLVGAEPEARFDWLYGYDAVNAPLPH